MTSETLDEMIAHIDKRFFRWELRRYTQSFDEGQVLDPIYTLALPGGLEPDEDGIPRTLLRDFGYAADPVTACKRALEEWETKDGLTED